MPQAIDGNEQGHQGIQKPKPTHHVDIQNAERLFKIVSQELSGNRFFTEKEQPGRAGEVNEHGSFDLEGYLRNQKQAENDEGHHDKHVDVSWDITVRGASDSHHPLPTFGDAIIGLFGILPAIKGALLSLKGPTTRNFDILHKVSGAAKSGEMVLVLGRPGSGCSTFLKTIANQRTGFTEVVGDVYYNGIPSEEFKTKYQGETVYNQEDDVFLPTLTVKQTLGFALDMKTPGERVGGLSKAEFKEKITRMLLQMFNIEHTQDTLVGDAYIRGVSGGERKRVSIAEMMTTNASVCCWDNTTRGLDASTALDYAKSLRIITDIYGVTTFVSLYQASENIYRQFDKVLVLDGGHQAYFGPASEARAYFEGLGFAPKPRQTTADYLTGCTDEYERDFAPGVDEGSIPATPDGLATAFRQSTLWEKSNREIADNQKSKMLDQLEEFHRGVAQRKRKHTSKTSVFSAPFHKQVWGNCKQLARLRWSAKLPMYSFLWTWLSVPMITASLVYKFTDSSNDTFSRAGLLFLACMLCAFQAISEMPQAITGRGVVNKHRSFTFYRPAALWLAQFLVDLLFLGTVIFFFSIIQYFFAGFAPTAGGFFTFYLTILLLMMTIVLLFRVGVIVNPDFDSALQATAFLIPYMILCSGFIVKRTTILGWIRCLVPSGPSYSEIQYQACTVAGSLPSQSTVTGSRYLYSMFGVNAGHVWRGIGVLFAFAAFYLVGTLVAGEKVAFSMGGRTTKFYIKEDEERKALNAALAENKKSRRHNGQIEAKAELEIKSKSTLTWQDLTYDVQTPAGAKRLLNGIDGFVEPGRLTALMGASGAGKTTLLDVLAQRKSVGVVSGDLFVDGKVPDISFQRGTAYCEQLDVHEPTATVREALRFSAYLRQPPEVPLQEKNAYVEKVIELLELEDIADVVIGSPATGLVVEERKRVTIGVELAAKPEMLLFLDEPTSGLDSQSAFNVVRFLQKLAAAGQAILCTIHQPNSVLFENFDRLLLLQAGGNTVYFGEIGQDAQVLRGYFGKNGATCPPDVNVAEWMLDVIGAGSTPAAGNKDWSEIWRLSPQAAKIKRDIQDLSKPAPGSVGNPGHTDTEYATSFLAQTWLVCKRTTLAYYRSPTYGYTRVINHILVALWQGLFFLNIGNSRTDLQYRIFSIFGTTVLPVLVIFQVQPRMEISRSIFYREHSSRMYSPWAFTTGMVTAEVPYSLLSATVFFVCLYLPTGMDRSPSTAGFQFVVILLTETFAVTLALAIQALTPSFYVASLLNPWILVLFTVMSGVMIPKPNMTSFWRAWMYELDPYTRTITTAATTALHGVKVHCNDDELSRFPVPAGQTCGEYMADFMAQATGYIVNANATDMCQYCAFSVGDEFLATLGISYHDRGRDIGILAMFTVTNLIILYAAAVVADTPEHETRLPSGSQGGAEDKTAHAVPLLRGVEVEEEEGDREEEGEAFEFGSVEE
ncbi:ATP-binding cassette transporter snq2 [Exophiala xenobiotica]|nr:ATP-binding cassette transporter snq2 [Exophiala xenobiotica]KAK5471505.1 ATP-binding cassette transporter snq2 [Exophiala xenobiotica]KAK5514542.1 ATP-binding cassette transporter snq2 [Exophiala xenobiotica]KAK5525749.1 ATP-binding cassette transporter snq2 [Exophiala xenobiotica]